MNIWKFKVSAGAWVIGFGLAVAVKADTVLVDFGGLAPANPVGSQYFNQWSPGQNIDLVLASDGTTDSGWNLDSTTAGAVNDGVTPDFTSLFNGAPVPFGSDTITSDALNLTPAQGVRNVRLFNLNPSLFYNITIFGARDSTQTRITDYNVIGSTTISGSLQTSGTGSGTGSTYNNDDVFNAFNIAPNGSGIITIEYAVDTGDFGYLNALGITVVPEPSSLILLLTGACVLHGCRRHVKRASLV